MKVRTLTVCTLTAALLGCGKETPTNPTTPTPAPVEVVKLTNTEFFDGVQKVNYLNDNFSGKTVEVKGLVYKAGVNDELDSNVWVLKDGETVLKTSPINFVVFPMPNGVNPINKVLPGQTATLRINVPDDRITFAKWEIVDVKGEGPKKYTRIEFEKYCQSMPDLNARKRELKGKFFIIEDKIDDAVINQSNHLKKVVFGKGDDAKIFCEFRSPYWETKMDPRATYGKKGLSVKIVGAVSDVDKGEVTFEECEIIESSK